MSAKQMRVAGVTVTGVRYVMSRVNNAGMWRIKRIVSLSPQTSVGLQLAC